MKGRVVSIRDETPGSDTDVKTFVFELERPIFCDPGQCIGVNARRDILESYASEIYGSGKITVAAYEEALKRMGKADGVKRMYSLVSLKDNLLCLEIERHEEVLPNGEPYKGIFSNFMHEKVGIGYELDFDDVCRCERFVYDKDRPRDYVGIAAGAGIPPILCILNQIADTKIPVNATVMYSVKTREDIIYKEKLDKIARENKNVKVIYTVTQIDENQTDWTGYRGRISKEMIIKEVPNLKDSTFFICGSARFATAMKESLVEIGIPADDIKISAG